MIKTIIVDDEPAPTKRLIKVIKEFCPSIKVEGTADSVRTGIMLIEKQDPGLVFLDIELLDGTGFDLLEHFADVKPHIIFTTAHDKYAIKAIKFSAVDYLLKPIDGKELQAAIQRVEGKLSNIDTGNNIHFLKQQIKSTHTKFSKIALPTLDGFLYVDLMDIIHCEANDNYTLFYLVNKRNILVTRSLKEYEDLLTDSNFCRIHHSHMINLAHMVKYTKGAGGYVIMSDDSIVEVAKRKREEFLRMVRGT